MGELNDSFYSELLYQQCMLQRVKLWYWIFWIWKTNWIMTLGLEWPCVFVASCNDGIIPMLRDPNLSEEG